MQHPRISRVAHVSEDFDVAEINRVDQVDLAAVPHQRTELPVFLFERRQPRRQVRNLPQQFLCRMFHIVVYPDAVRLVESVLLLETS
jgi:hypothetical protein